MQRSTDDADESIRLATPSERVRKLLAEAAELPNEERAELVDELDRTLPETYEQDEHDRQMEAVRRGTAVLIP
jgi:hypothetical protein